MLTSCKGISRAGQKRLKGEYAMVGSPFFLLCLSDEDHNVPRSRHLDMQV